MPRPLLILLFLVLRVTALPAQCPDRAALWARLIYIRKNSATIPPKDQLKELLPVLDSLDKCPFGKDSAYVLLLQRVADAYHKSNEETHAFHYIRASIDVIAAGAGTGKIARDQLYRSYFNLSLIANSAGLIRECNNAQDSFINLVLQQHIYPLQLYDALRDRAGYSFSTGDYQRSIAYSSIPDHLPSNPDPAIQNRKDGILIHRLNALLALHEYDSAGKIMAAGMKTASASNDIPELASLYGIAANIEQKKGRLAAALADFHREYDYFHSAGYAAGCAESLNAIGYFYFDQRHDLANALKYYRQALLFKDTAEAISTYDNMALLFSAHDQDDSALFYIQKAFDQIFPGLDETSLLTTSKSYRIRNMAEYVTTLILDKADVLVQLANRTKDRTTLRKALLAYIAGDRLLNRLRVEQEDFSSRLFWRTNSHRLYEHAITAAWQYDDPNLIYHFLEKSRAVLLNDQLSQQQSKTADDVITQAGLRTRILFLEKALAGHTDSPGAIRSLQSGLFAAQQALTLLEQRIRDHHPLYYRHFLDTTSVTLADIQPYLRTHHQSLLMLYSGDTAVFTLLITPDHVYPNKIPGPEYTAAADSLTACLADPSRLNRDMPGYIRIAHRLYRLIFPDSLPGGRIIISPDGNYFPFEALVTSDSVQNPSWFLYDHPTCYTYSGGYLLATSGSDSLPADKDFLGMAPVQYAGRLDLPALQGSDRSLERIAANFHSADRFTAGHASRNNFLHNFSRYRLIQLYTHAIGNTEREPTIFFADSALPLSDLIPEDKPGTRLIVLSACESGNGRLYRNEGIFSFNREFAVLGIPAAIVNRWSVDDRSTYRLTELFYKYLAAGDTADIALYKAKKEFILHASGDQRLPYYWAAPLLTGSPAILSHDNPSYWWTIPLLTGFFLFVFCLYKLNKLQSGCK